MNYYIETVKKYVQFQKHVQTRDALLKTWLTEYSVDSSSRSWFILLATASDDIKSNILRHAICVVDMPLKEYKEILKALGKETIHSLSQRDGSLIIIAAAFGVKERLELLCKYYIPAEEELRKGLFFAAYYGHQEVFEYIQEKLTLESLAALKDEDENTLLHVSVLGNQSEMVPPIASNFDEQAINAVNNNSRNACEEAVLMGNQSIINKIDYYLRLMDHVIDYNALILLLAKKSKLSREQESILPSLCAKANNDEEKISSLITVATNSKNAIIVKALLLEKKITAEQLALLINDAQQKNAAQISSILRQERDFQNWTNQINTYLLQELNKYIYRKSKDLESLAKKDSSSKYGTTSATDSQKTERKNRAADNILALFSENHKEWKEIYLNIAQNNPGDLSTFHERINLQSKELIQYVKDNNESNQELFKQQLWCTLTSIAQRHFSENSPEKLDNSAEKGQSAQEIKKEHFIQAFASELDKSYHFYLSLSTGELMRPTDNVDNLADIAKKAAGILPNVSVSPASLGFPIPLSINFPSSVVVVSIIDLCLFIRKSTDKTKATRVHHFFEGTTLDNRINRIYQCARSIAKQFEKQINVLDVSEMPYLAQLCIARLFDYISKSNENILIDSPSWMGTLFRKLLSNVMSVGPEPEAIQKSLVHAANDAITAEEHLISYHKNAECSLLTLSSEYRDSHAEDPDRQWTAKGIFEHTGICVIQENDEMLYYAGTTQNVGKYGYMYGKKEDAERRGMVLVNFNENLEKKPWFDRTEEENQRLINKNKKAANSRATFSNPFHVFASTAYSVVRGMVSSPTSGKALPEKNPSF